ncbi:MAG TPA: hypothetical protein VFS23_07345 [Vicinamibacterales bacterium]|nr:hypothetical protein [Vicinamibacterales bacterium]
MAKSVLLWLVSLVATAVVTASITMAQARPAEPRILSGTDVGVRIEGTDVRTGNPTGTLVVRIDGKWVEVGPASRVLLLK